ncbi:amidohydrolase family protein [Naasia aerilata]|uniref:Amidohydrolase-related domain-containing protein n=1 Tax=Naasia aerilata TaxID=1162966 RepID=A0ABN6XH13_9MICO|nr:amidohydrolase family protein [Naasia aerilata]BDZ44188.1 hypothetical protein GCM10025866_00970 [Naasia aerilata]
MDLLDRTGLLSARLSTAHNVWLEDADMRLLAERGVTAVHDPHSNLQVGSGIADLGAWRSHGMRAALGTDSVNCGGSMDMVDAMRLAVLLHRSGEPDPQHWETPGSALGLATAGASALRIGAGTLDPGQPADLAIFDLAGAPYASREDPLSTLVLGSWDHSARTVVVGGRVVLRDHRVLTIDEDAVIAEAEARRRSLMERNSTLRELADSQRGVLTRLSSRSRYPRPVVRVRERP